MPQPDFVASQVYSAKRYKSPGNSLQLAGTKETLLFAGLVKRPVDDGKVLVVGGIGSLIL